MDDNRWKARPKLKSVDSVKLQSGSINDYLGQLAVALGAEIPEERMVFYLKALADLTPAKINFVFDLALKRCKFFPAPSELLAFADEWRAETPLPDYIQSNLGKNPITELTERLQHKGVTAEDITRWKDEGRKRHEANIVEIAKSDMARAPGQAPIAIERQINDLRLAMNHRLARSVADFDREFVVRRA